MHVLNACKDKQLKNKVVLSKNTSQDILIMTIQVEKTPVLKGEDAKRFRNTLRKNLSKGNVMYSAEEKKRMSQNYDLMKSISGGTF